MPVNPISNTRKTEIEKKTAQSLPDNPSQRGYTPEIIKKRLSGAVTELITEINRIVNETNNQLVNIPDNMMTSLLDLQNQINELELGEIHVGVEEPINPSNKVWVEIEGDV